MARLTEQDRRWRRATSLTRSIARDTEEEGYSDAGASGPKANTPTFEEEIGEPPVYKNDSRIQATESGRKSNPMRHVGTMKHVAHD